MKGIVWCALALLGAVDLWDAALAAQAQASGLGLTEAFAGKDSQGLPAVFALGLVLAGAPLDSRSAVPAYEDCATACRLDGACVTFMYCGEPAGCTLPGNSALAFKECRLQTDFNCTLEPTVVARGAAEGVPSLLVSGFPARSTPPPAVPGMVVKPAQGRVGGDFPCAGSPVPGACAYQDPLAAGWACSSQLADKCTSVMVYVNGTDGCSNGTLLALLKNSKTLADNTFWAPTAYILERKDETGAFVLYSEATLTPPDNETELAEVATAAANGTAPGNAFSALLLGNATPPWLGCILVTGPALMDGVVNKTIDSVTSAEACCRECRKAGRAACNVFNWCPANETCRFESDSRVVTMQAQQCELRFQELADPSSGTPPYLIAKGASAGGFRAGAPATAWGPDLPGYTRYISGGLYGQRGTYCADTLLPEYMECVLSAPLASLAARCTEDPLCTAVIAKPGGVLSTKYTSIGALRRTEGANVSQMVSNPTSVTYFKDTAVGSSGSSGSSSSGGLSSGAVAGIAVGCVAAVVAAAAGGWALRRRQRRLRTGSTSAAPLAAGAGKDLEDGSSSLAPSPLLPAGDKSAGGASCSSTRGMFGMPPSSAPNAFDSSTSSSMAGLTAGSAPAGAEQAWRSARRPSAEVMKSAVIARRTSPSPFAAASSRPRFGLPASSADGSGVGGMRPGMQAVPASSSPPAGVPGVSGGSEDEGGEPGQPPELTKVMGELIKWRALEEAAPCSCSPPVQPSPTALSGSGGMTSGSALSSQVSAGSAAMPASLQAWLIPPEEVTYLKRPNGELAVLGQGASGRVLRAELRGETVAAKEVDLGQQFELQEAFVAEAHQLCNLRHPNVVTFYGCCVDKGKGILLTELCEGLDLNSVLRLKDADGQRIFGWHKHGCRVAFEVAKAINYLHSRGVAHMDIKSSNVLLTRTGMAKLCDVGLARMQTRTVMSDLPNVMGTFAWTAPEVLIGGSGCTLLIDLYSFGVLLWEIITGLRPVRGHMPSPKVPDDCPQKAADLMMACCSLDPADRPTAKQAMQRLRTMLEAQQEGRQQFGG